MLKKVSEFLFLAWWWVRARFFGRRAPMQSVVFISDRCNLSCKHCSVYNHTAPIDKKIDQIKAELEYCYKLGSRFVDFEGGEPFLWRDGDKTVDDLCDLAKSIGFFSCTITTNAQKPFPGSHADSIWVSMDGVGEVHDSVRGEGTFARLEKNIAGSGHKALSVNMAINTINYKSVADAIEYAAASPYIKSISLNFHTPFEGTERLALPWDVRQQVFDLIIDYKKKGYPIMNSMTGLKRMRDLKFKKRCWMTNYVFADGTKLPECAGSVKGACGQCGFCMAGEMSAVMDLAPSTILAGLKLRV